MLSAWVRYSGPKANGKQTRMLKRRTWQTNETQTSTRKQGRESAKIYEAFPTGSSIDRRPAWLWISEAEHTELGEAQSFLSTNCRAHEEDREEKQEMKRVRFCNVPPPRPPLCKTHEAGVLKGWTLTAWALMLFWTCLLLFLDSTESCLLKTTERPSRDWG